MKGLLKLSAIALAMMQAAEGARVADKSKNMIAMGVMYANYNDTKVGGLQDQMTTTEIGMRMAMEEINASPNVLMDATLVIKRQNSDNFPGGSQTAAYRLHLDGARLIFADPSDLLNYYSAAVSSFVNVPHVCMDCVSSDLADGNTYGTFIRMTSVAYVDGILNTIAAMGWKKISILYTIDNFCLQAAQNIKNSLQVQEGKLSILTSQAIQLTDDAKKDQRIAFQQLNPVFDQLKAAHTRVVILLASTELNDIIYYSAAAADLIGAQMAWVTLFPIGSTDPNQIADLFDEDMSIKAQGTVSVDFKKAPEWTSDTAKAFSARYTAYIEKVKNNKQDGESPLVPGTTVNYFVDGYPPSTAVRAYDLVWATAATWDNIINDSTPAAPISAADIASGIAKVSRDAISFTGRGASWTGINGNVTLDGTGSVILPGIINQMTGAAPKLSIVGTFSPEIAMINNSTLKWNQDSLRIPADIPMHQIDQLLYNFLDHGETKSDSFAVVLGSLYGFVIVFCIFTALPALVMVKSPAVREKGLVFIGMVSTGCILLCVEGITSMLDPYTANCVTQPWLIGTGFACIIPPVLYKCSRQWYLNENNKLLGKPFSQTLLFLTIAIGLVSEFIIIGGWNGANQMMASSNFALSILSWSRQSVMGVTPTTAMAELYPSFNSTIGANSIEKLLLEFNGKETALYIIKSFVDKQTTTGAFKNIPLWTPQVSLTEYTYSVVCMYTAMDSNYAIVGINFLFIGIALVMSFLTRETRTAEAKPLFLGCLNIVICLILCLTQVYGNSPLRNSSIVRLLIQLIGIFITQIAFVAIVFLQVFLNKSQGDNSLSISSMSKTGTATGKKTGETYDKATEEIAVYGDFICIDECSFFLWRSWERFEVTLYQDQYSFIQFKRPNDPVSGFSVTCAAIRSVVQHHEDDAVFIVEWPGGRFNCQARDNTEAAKWMNLILNSKSKAGGKAETQHAVGIVENNKI